MNINFLEWDSKHFECKVGVIHVQNYSQEVQNNLLQKIQDFDLVYVFSNSYEESVGKPINTKVYFQSDFNNLSKNRSENIELISKKDIEKVFELSLVAGHQSRFNLDPKIKDDKFKSLYYKWVEKSFSENHYVLGYKEDGHILGIVSLQLIPSKSIANIELIGVDTKIQGKQIGSKLITSCVDYIKQNSNITFLSVYSQKENKLGCLFYEKIGFIEKNYINIHHVWNPDK